MNIVQVSHRYRPSIGGIENYSNRLVNSMEENGHDVSVITTDMSFENDDSPLNAASNVTYCETTASLFRNPLSVELFQTIRNTNASLYHLHSPWYFSSLETVMALPNETPLVMTIHGFQPIQSPTAALMTKAYRPFAQYIFDRIDRTIVLGQAEKERLVSTYNVSADDISVIPNGIHPESYDVGPSAVEHLQTQYGLDPTIPTILFLSRLVPLKNPDILIEAVTEHLQGRELDVVIVGTGEDDYVEYLRARADDRIQFRANLQFNELKRLYHAADIFTLPSQMEGLPTVVLEAMNARLPIITTPVGALANVVDHRTHGWLLDTPPEAQSLANALRYYLENPSARQTVGRTNRSYVRTEFNWDNIADDIETIYRDVVDQSQQQMATEQMA